jgi:hypothetical protein
MFNTIDDIRAANRTAGQKWFDPGTMEFFSSRIEPKVYHGCYFISSEQYELTSVDIARGIPQPPRRWTIHLVTPRGWVSTMGEFQQYTTLQEAEEAVATLPPCRDLVTEVHTDDHDVEVIVD